MKPSIVSQEFLLKIIIGLLAVFCSLVSWIYLSNQGRQDTITTAINNRLYINEQKTERVSEKLDSHLFYTENKKYDELPKPVGK